MARLIPKIEPSEILNTGERKIAEALVQQLPSKVEVFHSFQWLSQEKDRLREGEADFVILHPDQGMLFIEVKGSLLRYVPDQQAWFAQNQDGSVYELKRGPFDQVRDSHYQLIDLIKKEIGGELPFTHGYAVAFPNHRYEGKLPPNVTPDLVFDLKKCEDISEAVDKAFDRWRSHSHPPLTGTQKDATYDAMFPRFGLIPVLWRKVEDWEMRIKRLTDEQKQFLDFISGHPKAAIRGIAGSGKTILALAKVQALVKQKTRSLLLCYNSQLKDWLIQAMPETSADLITVDTYHGIVENLCKKANIPFASKPGGGKDDEFWTYDAPELLEEACNLLGPEEKFEAIVVDEGQDFHDLWWDSLECLLQDAENKKAYYVFFDPKQNLFIEQPSLPLELGQPFTLTVNCRNTARIAEHCADLINEPPQIKEGAPKGDNPEIITAPNLDQAFREVAKKVRSWCTSTAGGLKNSQVAVLAPGQTEAKWPKDFQTVSATRNFNAWRRNEGVLITSWRRFKGLEADAIAIVETPERKDSISDQYVARSRAKHILTVVQVQSL